MTALRKETAYIAYHFHWSKEEILAMEHKERRSWVKEIGEINRKINDGRTADE